MPSHFLVVLTAADVERMENSRTRYARDAVDRALARISDANRPVLVQYLEFKRASGVRLSTLKLYAGWIQRVDEHLHGKPFSTVTPDDVTSFLAKLRAESQPGTVEQASSQLRVFVNWTLGDSTMTRTMKRAFKVLRNADLPDLEPASDDEVRGLIHHVRNLHEKAVVATLRDSGFRISELVALNVGSVEFDEKGGARLRIPPRAPDLKTGPRTVYVHRAAAYLRAHLFQHPFRQDPTAPLFVGKDHNGVLHRMIPTYANTFMARACARAGLRRIWPHLLRHSRVTEAAVNGWNEAQMRTYFGWSKTSRMPAHYTHYHHKHMEDHVLREAGVPVDGPLAQLRPGQAPAAPASVPPSEALALALAELLKRALGTTDSASAPVLAASKSARRGWPDGDAAAPAAVIS